MIFRTLAALALAALPAAVLVAQQPTFRAQVELVEIDAVVVDAQGNPVTGLTAGDFAIVENGKPQEIAAFSEVNIPIERGERPLYSPAAIEPDVLTNQGDPGRVYLIVLDSMHPMLALRTRHFLRRFIEQHLGANDVAGIAYTDTGANNSQDFTSRKGVLLAALDRFGGAITGEAPVDTSSLPGGGPPSSGLTQAQLEGQMLARSAMRSFRGIAEFMAAVPGQRKAILYISTGTTMTSLVSAIDYNGGTMSIEVEDAHAAMRAASRGHVAIYPIDPRGLTADGGGEEASFAAQTALATTPQGRLAESSNLRMLAEATGGFPFINQNNYDAAFTRLVRENSSYYILGFQSTNERRDGRFRRVQVRVTRPGLEVRTRSGYVAPRGRPAEAATPTQKPGPLSAAVTSALASPVPARGIPLTMFAAPFKGPNRDASVAIVVGVDPAGLELTDKGGVFTGTLEIATSATGGSRGKVVPGDYNVATLTLKPDSLERARRHGLQVVTSMSLAPGRYQLRAAVGNQTSKAGSVVYDIEVPDFGKGPLTMSGVALTSTAAASTTSLRPKDPLRDFLPSAPTSTRQFDAGETLTLFAEFYDNLRTNAAHTVDLTATLRADDGRVITTATEQRSSSELSGAAGGFGFTADLSLADAAPGIYVVHVEARINAGERPSVSRDVLITVR